jgi:hypothetical protein
MKDHAFIAALAAEKIERENADIAKRFRVWASDELGAANVAREIFKIRREARKNK